MKNLKTIFICLILSGFVVSCAEEKKEEAPLTPAYNPDAKVSFVGINDGDTVTSPVKIEFLVDGMEVRPAGDTTANSGHHHLIINGSYIKEGEIIPADEKHIHFGMGQTSTELEILPGNYNLTMQFADAVHKSYGKQLSSGINIVVVEKDTVSTTSQEM